MKLVELEVYTMAMELSELVWDAVKGWDFSAKDTVGKQLVRAADSIAANLSEGYGGSFTKRINSSGITAGVRSLKQEPGWKSL